jgi:prophage antirepressor-like protein
MKNSIVKFEFEGKPLTVVEYKGRPAFIAKEVGERLGYADNGGKITTHISGDWKESFQEGKHFIVVRGAELSDLKKIFYDTLKYGVAENVQKMEKTTQLMLLFEAGIHKVTLKSNKPEAERLQDFIVDHVMPQLVRDGQFSPDRHVDEKGQMHGTKESPDLQHRLLREDRLNRKMKAEGLKRLIGIMNKYPKHFAEESIITFEVKTAEVLTGESYPQLLPEITDEWKSPSQIGELFMRSANAIGRIISTLGIRGNPEYSKKICNKSTSSNREVESYMYNAKALIMIREMAGE